MTKFPGSKSTRHEASAHPTLSVIVPVYNAPAELKQCLAALAASHDDDFDVLVVDDGSTEPIESLVTP
jgi:glycosyltransferase involved in cell wall biosynthesis